MSTPTATPSPSRLWLYFQETRGMVLTASEESDIRHAANAAAESDIRTLETELAAAKAEAAKWKANHDNQVKLKSTIMSRPDLGDRAPRVVALMDELARLRAEVERLKKQIKDDNRSYGCELRDPNGTIWEQATKDHARAERAEAERDALRAAMKP